MSKIRSPQTAIIAGAPDLPPPPPLAAGEHTFFDGTYGGDSIRLAALRTSTGFVIQVGETLHKRNRLIGEILFSELAPTLLIAIGATALAWVGVARGLVSLARLRSEPSTP